MKKQKSKIMAKHQHNYRTNMYALFSLITHRGTVETVQECAGNGNKLLCHI